MSESWRERLWTSSCSTLNFGRFYMSGYRKGVVKVSANPIHTFRWSNPKLGPP
jgi:hypothetical protein